MSQTVYKYVYYNITTSEFWNMQNNAEANLFNCINLTLNYLGENYIRTIEFDLYPTNYHDY